MAAKRNWFTTGARGYATFKPDYPTALVDHLVDMTDGHKLAVDVGCGHGQLTAMLGKHFDRVVGIDSNASQLRLAEPHRNVEYIKAKAEKLPDDLADVDLITAAQSAHEFDLPVFYDEVRRVAKPGATVALITYGVATSEDLRVDDILQDFYFNKLAEYWPVEQKHVDNGYQKLKFPFKKLKSRELRITKELALPSLLGYMATWSAVKAAVKAGQEELLLDFERELSAAWSDPSRYIRITWPISIRLGKYLPDESK